MSDRSFCSPASAFVFASFARLFRHNRSQSHGIQSVFASFVIATLFKVLHKGPALTLKHFFQ